MNKAYLFAVILLFVPFTGCIGTEETDDIPSLRSAVDKYYGYRGSNNSDYEGLCGMFIESDGRFWNSSAATNVPDWVNMPFVKTDPSPRSLSYWYTPGAETEGGYQLRSTT